MESHLFTDVHLCERYEPLQQFSVFSDAFGVPACARACVVCVCVCVYVCVREREIKSFHVTDVRQIGYSGLLDGVLSKAFHRFSAQCSLSLSRSIDILAVAYAPSNSLRELLCLVG